MMRLIVEVKSGALAGRKFWLNPSQSQTVGRTARAGFVVGSDAHLSSVHFAVECRSEECRLRDLGSSNGTFLNEERVQSASLYEGDVIRAGDTSFAVSVKGGSPRPATHSDARTDPSPAASKGGRETDARQRVAFRAFLCRSQLILMRGVTSRFDIASICSRLTAIAPMYVVWGCETGESVPADGCEPAERLFDWNPEESSEGDSPIVFGPTVGDACCQVAANAWGKDAAICLFDPRPRPEVLQQLRQFARPRHGRPETNDLACFRPSAMGEFLANGEPADVASATQGTEAILLEVHQGERWAILGGEELKGPLQGIGLAEAPQWV